MSLLTKEKIKEIMDDRRMSNSHWTGSIENELFSTSYDNVKLAIKYGTKHYPINSPILMLGISITGEKHESETLTLCDRKDPRWMLVYRLWELAAESTNNKSAT